MLATKFTTKFTMSLRFMFRSTPALTPPTMLSTMPLLLVHSLVELPLPKLLLRLPLLRRPLLLKKPKKFEINFSILEKQKRSSKTVSLKEVASDNRKPTTIKRLSLIKSASKITISQNDNYKGPVISPDKTSKLVTRGVRHKILTNHRLKFRELQRSKDSIVNVPRDISIDISFLYIFYWKIIRFW